MSVYGFSFVVVVVVVHRNFYSEIERSRSFPAFPVLFPTFPNLKFKASVEDSTDSLQLAANRSVYVVSVQKLLCDKLKHEASQHFLLRNMSSSSRNIISLSRYMSYPSSWKSPCATTVKYGV